jgi:3-methylcrotonyl-CoA carboxylase alpha subunit
LAGARRLALPILAEGESVVAQIVYGPRGPRVTVDGIAPAADASAVAAGDGVYVLRHGRQTKVSLRDLALEEGAEPGGGGLVRAPMHGKVLSILVAQGDRVSRGQRLAIIEAMKMEHTLHSAVDGTVAEIAVAQDAQVAEGAKVMMIAPAEDRV